MKLSLPLLLISLSLSLLSCNKNEGCTDENAINYDITADKDDGSCIYCESITSTNTRQVQMIDDDWGSIYYGEEVISVQIVQTTTTINSSACGDQECSFQAVLTNLTEHDIQSLQFTINILTNTNQYFISPQSSVSIPVNESHTLNAMQFSPPCSSIEGASINYNLFNIHYNE